MHKIRIIYLFVFVAIIASFPNIAQAQTSISSPYSRFGIGNVNIFNNPINMICLKDEAGSIYRVLGVLKDITER
ncbi:MAG: hypothetical protein PHU35_02770, partial [Bacteroidales bacterium]|nr:hypothetical protein [Bacteroidales bacterium]